MGEGAPRTRALDIFESMPLGIIDFAPRWPLRGSVGVVMAGGLSEARLVNDLNAENILNLLRAAAVVTWMEARSERARDHTEALLSSSL